MTQTPGRCPPQRRPLYAFAFALLACTLGLPTSAATYRVDEAGTVVSQPVVNMRWRHLVPGRGADNTVEASVRVDVRLNLAPWLNKPARLYMVLAPVNSDRVLVRWTTQGRLLPGSLHSGDRALVFEGAAGPSVLNESLLLTMETDGERLTQLQNLNFHFEIEVSP